MTLLLALLWGCGTPNVPTPTPQSLLHGRWEPLDGYTHCLVLEPDGRFELTDRGHGPDLVVTGTWRPELAVAALHLTPERIHTERYVSSCRKHVQSARDHKREIVLGTEIALGEAAAMRVVYGGDRLGLCGQRCAVLERVPVDGTDEGRKPR